MNSPSPLTDRDKAVNYVCNMLSPGDHFNSQDLAHYLDRKKSGTLQTINYLLGLGLIQRIGSGPATSYLVLEADDEDKVTTEFINDPPAESHVTDSLEYMRKLVNPGMVHSLGDGREEILNKLKTIQMKLKLWHHNTSEWNENLTIAGREDMINHRLIAYMDGQIDLINQILKEIS